ncbi:MAG: ribonuclease D [Verrucomicrobiia bacterium]
MIVSDEQLAQVLPVIEKSDWVALDTEADSFYSYPEKLCLIQLSIPGKDLLIDPFEKINLEPLFQILHSKKLILHGADYDLRLLYKNYKFLPKKIFDTMYAARLLGYKEIGLGDLVKRHIGLTLDKRHQRSNWAVRPIDPRMIDYAMKDTRFLKPLEFALSEQLKQTNRYEWLQEVCERLILKIQNNNYADDPEAWRIAGSASLSPLSLSVLREVWHWREQTAIAENKPPFFVLNHKKLIDIALAATNGLNFRELIPKNLEHKIDEIQAAVTRGLETPPERLPAPRKTENPRLNPEQNERLVKILKARNRVAERLKVERSVLITQSEAVEIARNPQLAKSILMKWQYKILKIAIEW